MKEYNLGELLSQNCMLASLNVRCWSARKTDKGATAELLYQKNAASNAATLVKSLLAGNDTELKDTIAAYTRIRSFFYEKTSPWTTQTAGIMKGDRLVSTKESINFLSEFAKHKQAAKDQLQEFLNVYDQKVQDASLALGDLYDPSQYPHKSQLSALFSADLHLRPLPEATDFDRLQNVPASLATGLKELYERSMQQQMENALSDVQRRLIDELERMDTQLSKVATGEKTRLFKSMTTNLSQLVGMARSLNLTENAEIEAIATGIETHLLKYEVDMYKENVTLAGDSAKMAREIKKQVSENQVWKLDDEEPADVVKDVDTTVVKLEKEEVQQEAKEDDAEFLATLSSPEFDENEFLM